MKNSSITRKYMLNASKLVHKIMQNQISINFLLHFTFIESCQNPKCLHAKPLCLWLCPQYLHYLDPISLSLCIQNVSVFIKLIKTVKESLIAAELGFCCFSKVQGLLVFIQGIHWVQSQFCKYFVFFCFFLCSDT